MNKYINIIVIGFCSVVITQYDFGYPCLIPIIGILSVMNSKNLLLLIPTGIISNYIFNPTCLLTTGIFYVMLILYLLLLAKKENYILDFIYFLLINGIVLLVNSSSLELKTIYIIVIYSVLSSIFFVILKYIVCDKKYNNSFSYFEVLAIAISVIGGSLIEYKYNIGFFIAVFYAMYLSNNTNIVFSIVFCTCSSIYLYYVYKIDYAVILPFISIIYSINSILSGFITIITLAVVCFFYREYFPLALVICIIALFFEIVKSTLINTRIKKREVMKDIYKNSVDILNNDLIAFSSFLDLCMRDTDYTKEYYKRIEEGIDSIVANYCLKCHLKGKCHRDDNYLRQEMSELIKHAKDVTYDIHLSDIFSICPYNIEMRKSAIIINEKIDMKKTKSKSQAIVSTLTGVSNILRQFTVENNIKKEIKYEYIFKLKRSLCDNGYNVTFFNIARLFENDFCIEVGIRGLSFDDIKDDIELIISRSFPFPVTMEYNHSERGKTYFNIIPKLKCRIEYGSSNIAAGVVSGDNILVSDNSDGKTIAVICDGMGKGYKANVTSDSIIRMLDELRKSSLSTYAIVQILNTYCSIKDSLESFCTLDFLEVDKKTNNAVFYKMSAAPSYIFHKNSENIKIDNQRLPLGKENEIITDTYEIKEGDVIIMSSDGIFDNVVNESELEDFIGTITHLSAEKIIYQILSFVKKGARFSEDDISLIVLKVLEC